MDILFNIAVIWFLIGFAFFLFEFVVPGFILFFFGVGAWVVAVLSLFIDISVNTQLLVFIGSSLVTVLLFRNWVKDKLGIYKETTKPLEDELIGKIAVAETSIMPGDNGKVEFRGASWDAYSDEAIAPGEKVTIIDNKSILLIVKSTKSI